MLLFSKFVTEKVFRKIQIIMTLSIPGKAKVNAKRYRLIEECKSLLPSGFISQQDSSPAHMAKLAQDWIATSCSAVNLLAKMNGHQTGC